VITAIQNEMLGEQGIMWRTNLKQTQVRVIKADLIEQRIAREVAIGKSKKLEYIPGAPPLNVATFEALRNAKKLELEQMIQYIETDRSRMKFLCEFLGDTNHINFTNCDNTGLRKLEVIHSPDWDEKLKNFHESYFPELELEHAGSKLVNGVAASLYGVTNVGSALHRSKYEGGGDFPDFLVSLVMKAFRKRFGQKQFDLVLYVPPTVSGDLVKNFAEKISQILNVPISHDLVKTRETKEQKVFENSLLKEDNVKNVFTFNHPDLIARKSILLIDDICDSGHTLKEIGKCLTHLGAAEITPLVIAKTVGGDLS
jgi:ATP-dependent DNA helicase RecQ